MANRCKIFHSSGNRLRSNQRLLPWGVSAFINLPMRKHQGFTLIELMTAIAILAVIAVFALPGFQWLMMNNRITTDVNRFHTSLMLARSEAMKRGSRITICKSADGTACNAALNWESGWLMFVDFDQSGTINGADVAIEASLGLRANYTLRNSGGNFANWVGYAPDGTIRGSGGNNPDTYRLCGPNADLEQARTVNINAVGRAVVSTTTAACP